LEEIDYKAKFSLDEKVIIITGGCGLIGRVFAEACAQYGANVVIADISDAEPESFAKELGIRQAQSRSCWYCQLLCVNFL